MGIAQVEQTERTNDRRVFGYDSGHECSAVCLWSRTGPFAGDWSCHSAGRGLHSSHRQSGASPGRICVVDLSEMKRNFAQD